MNYEEFDLVDFVLDESFQQWVLSPSPETNRFWQQWQETNPGKTKVIDQAKAILRSLDYKKSNLAATDKANLLTEIQAKIQADQLADELKIHGHEIPGDDVDETLIYSLPVRKKRNRYRIPVAAAVLLLMMVTGYLLLFPSIEKVVHQTGYGETAQLSLPDGSQVVLNANSSISFLPDWDEKRERAVTLEGEAFFSISHTADHQKFIVHSKNIEVEVLGTEFNVNNRRGKSQVVLQSGKVKLNLNQEELTMKGEQGEGLVMKPGDLVEVSDKDTRITKKVVKPEHYSAWTNDVLIFDKMPLSEVFEMIQDNYGYNVIVLDEGIEQRLFTAEISSTDLDFIIIFLSKSFDLHITKQNDELLVKKN